MRIEARQSAVIEILDSIEEAMLEAGLPADAIVTGYFRARRYAGSKDRRYVNDMVYAILRKIGTYSAVIEACDGELSGRALVILHLLQEGEELSSFGAEITHAPVAISDDEEALVAKLKDFDFDSLNQAQKLNMPEWLVPSFEARFGDNWGEVITALNGKAALDIRANPMKLNRENVFGKLVGAGHRIERTPLSPYGLRSEKKIQLSEEELYREGWIEVQDEAAQLASIMVGGTEYDYIVDLCAGAGGKAIMIAGLMGNKGQIKAHDISQRRLRELEKRAERAGVDGCIEAILLPEDAAGRSKKLDQLNMADKVILDVPCSGTGTWRRNPDQRWRLTAEMIAELQDTQLGLLNEGATLVKQDGLLFYMTCSLLPAENEEIVDKFLSANDKFKRISALDRLNVALEEADTIKSLSTNKLDLQLAPHSHNTDGFFVSVLQRIN